MAGRVERADVVVVGGGPAGAVLAWDLARRGVGVVLVDRARFPREKVCGDYVDPRGLRILERMGCLDRLEQNGPLPITDSAMWVDWQCRYSGRIEFYGLDAALPPHGYILPRDELDAVVLAAAGEAGATVHEETSAVDVVAGRSGMELDASRGGKPVRYRAPLVVGADGVNSVVARSRGLLVEDERHIAVAQRAYAVPTGAVAAAVSFFDESLFPGYGWMFPIADGRVNVGVGILAETRRRLGIHVPTLFADFVNGLRRGHPACAGLELCAPPIGGIVKTYGGAGSNHFDGGLLVGDAGGFVDPMTGEGISPAMESALLAAPVLEAALEAGRFDAAQLSAYESAFRAHFDPAMGFLDLAAATLRNPHFARPWLDAMARGCAHAQADRDYAREAGGYFGGLDIRPFGILAEIWRYAAQELALAWPRSLARRDAGVSMGDVLQWNAAWSRSLLDDPLWHFRWTLDVQRKWLRLVSTLREAGRDPRAADLLASP